MDSLKISQAQINAISTLMLDTYGNRATPAVGGSAGLKRYGNICLPSPLQDLTALLRSSLVISTLLTGSILPVHVLFLNSVNMKWGPVIVVSVTKP